MRIRTQEEILDLATRKKIISEIESSENRQRKDEAYRRTQCMRDKTNQEVRKLLLQMFSPSTVNEMQYSMTNLSIVKKVIKKLARVYKDGVKREVPDSQENTNRLRELAEKLRFNQRIKTLNQVLRLQKNAPMYIKPCKFIDNEGEEFWRPRPTVLHPYLYDVVEDFYDRTQPLVFVLSDYSPNAPIFTTLDPARVRNNNAVSNINGQIRATGNSRDELIADKKEDEGENENDKQYIWWSGKYHFTTNALGQVLIDEENNIFPGSTFIPSEELGENPIDELPFENLAIDQDNSFWAEGGEDLVDGAIVVNSLMTQNNHIAVTQGYGQYWMAGKNLPDNVEVGPNRIVKFEHEISEVDPQPRFGVVNANPPLSELQDSIEAQVALILTTNNLSTSGLSGTLDGGANFASGVALVIDKAESLEDVNQDRQLFAEAERNIWRKTAKLMQYFSEQEMLDPELEELIIPEDIDVVLEFSEPQVIASEAEKLNALEARQRLGINTDEELIMMDRKDFTEEMATQKLEEIRQQKMENMDRMMEMTGGDPNQEEENPFGNQDDEDERDDDQDQ